MSPPTANSSQPNRRGNFGVWSAERREDYVAWLQFWKRWPTREIHAHPGYVKLYCHGRLNYARAAYFESPDGCVLYPFVLRDLTVEPYWTAQVGPARDIISPYGYGGPFAWGDGDRRALAESFWPQFDAWANSHQVVSEFVRFNLFPDHLLDYPGQREVNQQNVIWDLAPEEDAIWRAVDSKVRRNVQKARQHGLAVEFDSTGERLEEFRHIYTATMNRREVGQGYYFPAAFYQQLQRGLAGQFAYALALYQGRVVSAQLILLSAECAYFFLGGTDADFFEHRPNDLLMYEIALWLKGMGKRWYVLGGGPTPNDGVFRFKQSFAPAGLVPFYVGRRVLDPERYERLVHRRQEMAEAPITAGDFFPAYRAGTSLLITDNDLVVRPQKADFPTLDLKRTASEFNVLLSSAGHRIERVKMFTWTLDKLRLPGYVLVTDMSPISAAFQAADGACAVPPCDSPEYIPTMLRLCRENNVRLLVPNIDPELGPLAAHRDEFAAFGTTVLVSTPEVVEIGEDKFLTHQWLTEHGFPTVRQGTLQDVLAQPDEWPYPLVVKPRNGSASRGVAIVFDRDELLVATRRDEFLVQTLARGQEYTVDVLANRQGRCLCAVPRRRVEVRGGEVSKGITVRNERIMKLAAQICEALPGAYGPLNIQLFHDQATDDLNVIEINPRFGGGFPLAWQAGAKFPKWIIEEILEQPSTAAFDGWSDQLVMLRFFSAVFVEFEELDAELR